MKQLSGLDNLFLGLEKPNQYMHVAALGIYDPSTAPGGQVRFKSILDFFTNRLNTFKIFRRRLVEPPFFMDRPYWIDCARIDVEYHVRHIGLPHPGDWRQLMIQIARIHSRPLDLTKPLWEAYIIEGLDNIPGVAKGSFALYIKFHHAAVDGESGVELLSALHSLDADFDEAGHKKTETIIADREPNTLELATRAVGHRANQVVEGSKLALNLGKRALDLGREYGPLLLEMGEDYISRLISRGEHEHAEGQQKHKGARFRPHTRFNDKLSPHRVVDGIGFPMDHCKEIRQHVAGTTVNDIFLTVVGGAMNRYLDAKGELPDTSMAAMVPVSTRGGVKGQDAGNQIGVTIASLKSDVSDPVKRLLAVSKGAKTSKKVNNALGPETPKQLLNILPGAISQRALIYAISSTSNVTVSNVHGPDDPLYFAGAKMQMFMPVSVSFEGSGLNVTGFSYAGTLWIALTCCRSMMPDPAFFTECLQLEFDALLQGAKKYVKHAAPRKAVKKSAMKSQAAATP